MNFDYTTEQQELIRTVDALCSEHCSEEQLRALEAAGEFPDTLYAAMAEAGLLSYIMPPPLGHDGKLLDSMLICERLGRASGLAATLYIVNTACAVMIAAFGDERQHKEYLEPLAAGKTSYAFALTEPEAGSDAAAMTTRARQVDGGFTITGRKLYTTGAADAKAIVTVARTDMEEKASRGTSLFLVPADSKGLSIDRLDKIAGNAQASCDVRFDEVFVPENALLGPIDQGWSALKLGGGFERLAMAACSVGFAESLLELATAHAKQRRQFGSRVFDFQAVSHKLANMKIDIEAARWLNYRAAWLVDQGRQPFAEICMSKCFASERLVEAAIDAMRVLGGQAYLRGNPAERILREGLLSLYAGGTNEIQLGVIARSL